MNKPITRQQFLDFLEYNYACNASLRWIKRNKGNPYSLLMKCNNWEWAEWFVYQFHSQSQHPAMDAYYLAMDVRDAIKSVRLADRVADEARMQYCKAWIMDNWPVIEAKMVKVANEWRIANE
jgi:hypothetical protein